MGVKVCCFFVLFCFSKKPTQKKLFALWVLLPVTSGPWKWFYLLLTARSSLLSKMEHIVPFTTLPLNTFSLS